MPRLPGHSTPEGQRWIAELQQRQLDVDTAERKRDETAQDALEHGLGIRGVAKALGIDKTTAQRRYGGRRSS